LAQNPPNEKINYKDLVFLNCVFKKYLQIKNCSFKTLEFKETCKFEAVENVENKDNKETKFFKVEAKSFAILPTCNETQGICEQKIEFSACSFNKFQINQYRFEKGFSLTGIKYIKAKIDIQNTHFEDKVSLSKLELDSIICEKNIFKKEAKISLRCNEANFKKCSFYENAFFDHSIFKDNVYFNNSKFNSFSSFKECEFEKTACYYGVSFDKVPNFPQVAFKGVLNVTNTNLNFDFNILEDRIKSVCEEFNKNKSQENKKSLVNFAHDFRDSFRSFKEALIKQNNLLDAQKYHKFELYCKEIELKNDDEKWIIINN